jgi:MoCo/4Fe-4S cofactor protein with predicted Tat translocation signal
MKKYWKSLEELNQSKEVKKKPEPEFSIQGLADTEVKGNATRRDFLKMLGFTLGYATLASSCEMPVRKAIPFLNKPEEITPGEANFYASSYFDGNEYCSILVKVREGRPIKIEGNKLSPITKGGTNARVQASVLNLYDTTRLKNPLYMGNESDWSANDEKIIKQFEAISASGDEIAILSSSIISPSMKQAIKDFQQKYPSTKWVVYDAVSFSAMLEANKECFGQAIIPTYDFGKAELILSFNADFLGNWLSSIEYTKAYSLKRKLNGEDSMSKHIQFETNMSLTGSNADQRHIIKPSDEGKILLALYNELAAAIGVNQFELIASPIDVEPFASALLQNKGKSLVISGSNNLNTQLLVNAINQLLGNYGQTIDLNSPLNIRQGIDKDMYELVERMNQGIVKALMVMDCNPVYSYYDSKRFMEGLKKVPLGISFAAINDETAKNMQFVCPEDNYLEAWGDAEPVKNSFSLAQPTISRLFDTRSTAESLLKWSGKEINKYDYIKNYWEENIFPLQDKYPVFEKFWAQSLHDGVFEIETESSAQPKFSKPQLKINANGDDTGLELLLYQTIAIGDGKHANNPWLQELPDPITKATWDNYVNVSPAYAEKHQLKQEDVVSVNGMMELPILIQPGHCNEAISIALGYGRTSAGQVADGIGKNAFELVNFRNGNMTFNLQKVELKVTGATYPLALTQSHHEMEGRPIVRETTLKEWQENPDSGNKLHGKIEKQHVSLYEKPNYPNFQWGMAIDLNSCIGCGACAIACQAENNVAVIGKQEVRNRRIMHWIRIDRYYSEDTENPQVFHQPVMCQHCDNAPCENVCPVAATPHSDEGLNMMAYNRCIGTRYCMNNCPYRVRRFNWFEYVNNSKFPFNMSNQLGKMVLNPDVVVRSRGVVEKCSFCSQRIQEKKLEAKKENRQMVDGDIKVACEQACPAEAIVFGNLKDKNSKVSKAFANPRNYHLLEELHTLPSVGYLTKVRNTDKTVSNINQESEKH